MPAAGKKTAERFGLIGEIDRWVTRQAIRSEVQRDVVQSIVDISRGMGMKTIRVRRKARGP